MFPPKYSHIFDKTDALEYSDIAKQYSVTPLYEVAWRSSVRPQGLSNLLTCLNRYVPYSKESVSFYIEAIRHNLKVETIEPLLKILHSLECFYDKTALPNQISQSELYHLIYKNFVRYGDVDITRKYYERIASLLQDFENSRLKRCFLTVLYLFPLSLETLPIHHMVVQMLSSEISYSLLNRRGSRNHLRDKQDVVVIPEVLTELKKAGITYSRENHALFDRIIRKFLRGRKTPDFIGKMLTLLSVNGFSNTSLNHSLYVNITCSQADEKDINKLFELINRLYPELEQRRQLLTLILEYWFDSALLQDIEQLFQAGFSYSLDTKDLYQTLLDFRKTSAGGSLNILKVMRILKKLIPDYQENKLIYCNAIPYHMNADKFGAIFQQVHQYGFCLSKPEGHFLYIEAMKSEASVEQLGETFRILQEIGPLVPEKKDFYKKLLLGAKDTPKIFELLRKLGCLYGKEQHSIYNTLIQPSYNCVALTITGVTVSLVNQSLRLLEALYKIGCFYSEETKSIYFLLREYPNDLYVINLAQSGFQYTPSSHAFLYSVLTDQNKYYSETIIFNDLFQRGYPYSEENHQLYEFAFYLNTNHEYRCESFLSMLSHFSQFQSKRTPELFNFLMHYPDVFLSYGFDLNEDTHIQYLEALGAALTSLTSTPPYSEILLKQVQQAFNERPELSVRVNDAQKLIVEVFGLKVTPSLNQQVFLNSINTYQQSVYMSNGPLIYNSSTRYLQALIDAFIDNPHLFRFEYDERINEYVIFELNEDMQVKQEVNLSLLFKNANLTQLMPSDETSDALWSKLNALLDDFMKQNNIKPFLEASDSISALNYLPQVLKKAIFIYTLEYYSGINEFFRGEKWSENTEALLKHEPFKFVFFIGVLVTYALNMLPSILHRKDILTREKEIIKRISAIEPLDKIEYNSYQEWIMQALSRNVISQEEYDRMTENYEEIIPLLSDKNLILYRRERYEYEDERKNILAYRTTQVTKLPALTSTSSIINPNFFDSTDNLYIFYVVPPIYPSVSLLSDSQDENEVILPPGLQVVHLPEEQGLAARIVSSPDYDRDEYWSQHALRYVFLNYLSKPYKDETDSIWIDETEIHRPVHGVAHTQRVMSYIPLVIDYFAIHANDEAFRSQCQFIRNTNLEEMIKIAAAFSVSGRESEVSFIEHPEKYKEYRKRSKVNFLNYWALFPESCSHESVDLIAEIIEYMGDPDYPSKINTMDLSRREKLCCYYILSMAHKLDLPRCYVSEKMQTVFTVYEQLILSSDLQQFHFNLLQRYALELMSKHGDKYVCHLHEDHQWIDVETEYGAQFSLVSQFPKSAEYYSATIRKPILGELLKSSPVEKIAPYASQDASIKRKSATREGVDLSSTKDLKFFQPAGGVNRKKAGSRLEESSSNCAPNNLG
ncbi:SidE phosphodiesterase domain-containing protein [Legionella yabuuchiae]|uniref:SidE phosphodiesterase domain-containing protein n=1 Tax=Legionella yabuuchiae TaxID=376727 RepID=UPI001055D975|nr:SidE phosphodiesterase domain-containing protein [Legionella yabuuchiae]